MLPLTVIAFWPSYFGVLGAATSSDHLHGLTGTAWLLLVAAQSWTIHHGHRQAHRAAGRLAFMLAPLLIAGFAYATHAGAVKAAVDHPFYVMFGQALLTADLWMIIAIPVLLFLGFRHRRQVRLHSALMLSTLLGLLPPMFARLYAGIVPGLTVRGPDTFHRFENCLLLAVLTSLLVAGWLYWRNRRDGWPWLLAGAMVAIMHLLYLTLGQTNVWDQWTESIAAQPAASWLIGGAIFGLAACLAGWRAGSASNTTRRREDYA